MRSFCRNYFWNGHKTAVWRKMPIPEILEREQNLRSTQNFFFFNPFKYLLNLNDRKESSVWRKIPIQITHD